MGECVCECEYWKSVSVRSVRVSEGDWGFRIGV